MHHDRYLYLDNSFRVFGDPLDLVFILELKKYIENVWNSKAFSITNNTFRFEIFDFAAGNDCYCVFDFSNINIKEKSKTQELILDLDLDWVL